MNLKPSPALDGILRESWDASLADFEKLGRVGHEEILRNQDVKVPTGADTEIIRQAAGWIMRAAWNLRFKGNIPSDVENEVMQELRRVCSPPEPENSYVHTCPSHPKPELKEHQLAAESDGNEAAFPKETIALTSTLELRDHLEKCLEAVGDPAISEAEGKRFERAFAHRVRTPGEYNLEKFIEEHGLSTAAAKPITLRVLERLLGLHIHDGEKIPAALLEAKRWCGYVKTKEDKKPPHSPVDGSAIGATKEYVNHFLIFDEAVDGVAEHCLDGLGFVLMEGDGLVGIDIDHCVTDGVIHPEVENWLRFFSNTYAEFSPSGEGIHVIGRGKLAKNLGGIPLPGSDGVTVEVYSHHRYLTFTGRAIDSIAEISDCQLALDKLLDHLKIKDVAESSGDKPMTPEHARKVYADLLAKLRDGVPGSRNNSLNSVTFFAARAHAGGLLNKDEAALKAEITEAGLSAGLDEHEIVRTLESSWQAGSQDKLKIRLTHHCTDLGNAERFILRQGERVRYVPAYGRLGWLVWDGHRWKQDGERLVQELAQDTVRAIYLEAAAAEDDGIRKGLASWAMKSESARCVAAMLEMAQAGGVAVEPTKLDANPDLLNLENATLDLRTGEIREQRPSDLITRMLPVRYDPHASCPLFEKHMQLVLPDPAVRDYFMEVIAYGLSGSTAEQCIHILLGDGETGKSTTSDLFRDMAGDYGLVVKRGFFSYDSDKSVPPYELAELQGRRLVTCSEFEEGDVLRIALVKSLTSGQGAEIPACRKYGHPFKFRPQVSFLLDSNYLLKVDSPDWGTWRRIRVIPFDQKIPTSVKDPHIASRLWAERSGILNLVIQALKRYNARGRMLEVPDAIKRASGKYERDSDLLAQFIDERCVKGEGKSIKLRDFTRAYQDWAQKVTTRRKARVGEREMKDRLDKKHFRVAYDPKLRANLVEDLGFHCLFGTEETDGTMF